jgi:hypothetical protein
MNRNIKVTTGALVVGAALIGLGLWKTMPSTMLSEVALPNTWTGSARPPETGSGKRH